MRLLNCHTRLLEEFVGDEISHHPYAILSHTWEEQEVVFSDITQDTTDHTVKKGWYKISKSCEQAVRDGIGYVWADTVCIDKSSSAELSEAINSMFKWYRGAAVCYAYLCDLPEVPLPKSRWFTRGWTLQEMIAPEQLRFYDKEWNYQGSKAELLDTLRDITGVDRTALRGGDLRFFSVARKMSWASSRHTSREEDMAYCLLGIFDISMPLLYGEGSKAFIRLQEEILKVYEDESIFAWTSTAMGHTSGLLAPSPAAFGSAADLVPCLTPADTVTMSGPISITSRGIRFEVPVEKFEENKYSYVVRLNCKPVFFDRQSGMRVGIIVTPMAKTQGYPSSASLYGRTQPHRLHYFTPNPDSPSQTLFLLKENHLQDFDLAAYDVFLIRTMPKWPGHLDFRLATALPPAAWDSKNDTFRRRKLDNNERPFILVFRRTDAETGHFDHFIVTLGREITPLHLLGGILGGRVWCNAIFRRVKRIEDLNLEREIQSLQREEKSVVVEGAGVSLKCHVRPEVMSGQPLFCVDLLVKEG